MSDYRCYHNLVFWHRGAFRVSVERSSGKVAAGLFNEKDRLENIFSGINFHGHDKIAIYKDCQRLARFVAQHQDQ